jgi:hypothetical protein
MLIRAPSAAFRLRSIERERTRLKRLLGHWITRDTMKILALLLLGLLSGGCSGPDHVSSAEFKKQYGWVGRPQTMHEVAYLGQRDGLAFIRVSSMRKVQRTWSDRIIYVELSELDATFRGTLPKTEFAK